MAKKEKSGTRGRIIEAAWHLFYEQGYEDTTIEEIIELSQTSKGSFYHYFEGKDALLRTLSYIFDEKYNQLMQTLSPDIDRFECLLYLNRELFTMVENSVPRDLLERLYSSQLITRGERHLLDQDRVYYRLLRRIVSEGQERHEIRGDVTVNEVVHAYAMLERALIYDWCICGGDYSLPRYSGEVLPRFLASYRAAAE